MIYVGIYGAQTPLGKKVINLIESMTDEYRIVFLVDKDYDANSVTEAKYENLDAALSFNQPPSVIIDCGDADKALERAKTYRFYSVPAILCCSCKLDELDTICRVHSVEDAQAKALLLVSDYSVNNTRLMTYFTRVGTMHRHDIDRLEIEVYLSEGMHPDLGVWLNWAQMFNEALGVTNVKTSVKGSTCYCGLVIIDFMTKENLAQGSTETHVRLFYGNKSCLSFTQMRSACEDLLENQAQGVMRLLEWFVSHSEEVDTGKVFTNHLSTVLFDKSKKNLQ